jgi:hypothetical protein
MIDQRRKKGEERKGTSWWRANKEDRTFERLTLGEVVVGRLGEERVLVASDDTFKEPGVGLGEPNKQEGGRWVELGEWTAGTRENWNGSQGSKVRMGTDELTLKKRASISGKEKRGEGQEGEWVLRWRRPSVWKGKGM